MIEKPFNQKSYGSIGHLPNSRLGTGDHSVAEGQAIIATAKKRDKHDRIIVQEKLDGSNVGVGRLGNEIIPMGRAGYRVETSPYPMHQMFYTWVMKRKDIFLGLLSDNERICGEWLLQAHSTRYNLNHEPFVAFDLMTKHSRVNYDTFMERVSPLFPTPHAIELFDPLSVESALERIGAFGFHGALDVVEGAVWRIERSVEVNKGFPDNRQMVVDFLTKFVRPDKQDGSYFSQFNNGIEVWNGIINNNGDFVPS